MGKNQLFTVCGGVLLLVSAWAAQQKGLRSGPPAAEGQATSEGESRAPEASSYRFPPLAWERGDQLRFALHYSGQIPTQSEGQKIFDVAVSGQLHLTVLAGREALLQEGQGFTVWAQLEDTELRSGAAIPPSLELELANAFRRGAAFRVQERGFALELLHGAGLSKTAQYFWEALALRARVQLPTTIATDSFSISEKIAGAVAQASYVLPGGLAALSDRSATVHLQKTLSTGPAWQSESSIVFQPRFAGLGELQNQSRETMDLGGQVLTVMSELRLEAKPAAKISTLADFDARLQHLLAAPPQNAGEESVQRAVLGDLSFEELWSQLDGAAAVEQDAYLKLKAWIILNPGRSEELGSALRPLAADDTRLRAAIKALGAAGHPEAQALLLSLMQERSQDVPLMKRLVTTLGLVSLPSPAAERAVSHLMQSSQDPALRRSAQLALGIMGGRLLRQPGQEVRGQAIEKKALDALRLAKSDSARQDLLAMLGNLGPTSIGSLAPYLKHENPSVRAQAYFALRRSPDPETPQRLVRAYGEEKALEVRRQILEALYYREADAAWFEGVREILEKALPVDEQLFLARALARHAAKDPRQSASLLADIEAKIPENSAARQQLAELQQIAAKTLESKNFN